jgi:AraC-like DNA-binding protein
MSESAREFRRAVAARNREGGVRRRFGSDLRARAIAWAQSARRAGQKWEEIARELGVSATLLQRWCRESTPSFVRVEVEEVLTPAASGRLRLVTPAGEVIEGLDVAAAAELVRRLR